MRRVPEKRLRAETVGHDGCAQRRPISVGDPDTSAHTTAPGREQRRQRSVRYAHIDRYRDSSLHKKAPSRSEIRPDTAPDCAGEAVSLTPPVLDVVVPVHNEEAGLEASLRRLHEYLTGSFPYSFRITVAENASIDSTVEVARRVAAELPGIDVLVLPGPGRGRALRTAWLASDATVLAYMDVDLSTDLAGLLPLVAPLISGHSDLAIGSRLSPSSRVVRGAK